jgi:hypothetical protein
MRLARRASIANDDETIRELAGAAAAVGLRRDVRLSYSTDVQSAVTFGVAKPYVLLPAEAKSWSTERRRAVLVHEAAHVARGDWLSQAIGQFACELIWFHPLAWRAFAHLRDDAERAADDAVLRSGVPALEYATHLLELARRTSTSRTDLVAVGIVSMSDLERRLLAMFDATRSRTSVTSRTRAVTTGVALAIVCPLASLRVAAPAQLKVPTARHASDIRVARSERDTARVSPTPAIRATGIGQPASETSQSSMPVVEQPVPRPIVHPDFSGRWTSDIVAVPRRVQDYSVTDSLIFTQSVDSMAWDSRGRFGDTPTHNRYHGITFDGAEHTGVNVTGTKAMNVVLSTVWAGDTLVLTSHALAGDHVLDTVERMTLSADRNTLSSVNDSFLDGRQRWDGPYTYVLRRIAP